MTPRDFFRTCFVLRVSVSMEDPEDVVIWGEGATGSGVLFPLVVMKFPYPQGISEIELAKFILKAIEHEAKEMPDGK